MIYDNINDKAININLWILKNINKIRLSIEIVLGFAIVIIYSILFANISDFVESNKQLDKIYDSILRNQNFVVMDNYLKSIAPESLVLESYGAVMGYSDKYYDFYALVKNKNTNYLVDSIDYYFKYDGNETDVKRDKISINAEKFLFYTGIPSEESGSILNVEFAIKDINWKLVSKHEEKINRYSNTNVPKGCLYVNNGLSVENIRITRNVQAITNREVNVLSFDIKNSSLYNYRAIDNKIIFYNRDGAIVGIFQKELYLLPSGESKSMSINISPNVKDITNVLVVPEIDLCSEGSFIPK